MSLGRIVNEEDASAGWKAESCLRELAELPPDDLAEGRLATGAIVYAILQAGLELKELSANVDAYARRTGL